MDKPLLCWMQLYRANSIVLTVRRKTPKPTDRSRNSVGSEFQTIGPATEKARWPNVIRRQRLYSCSMSIRVVT